MFRAPQLAPKAPPHQTATLHRRTSRRVHTILLATALAASASTLIAPRAIAQDLGEIARQERAKKQNNPVPPATHIYTNEDMQRQQILTPGDKSRFSVATQPSSTKPSQSTTQLASELTPGNADRLIGARPPILAMSTAPDTTSPPTRTSIRSSAQQPTKQLPAQPNISPVSKIRAKANSAPATRTNISAASTASAKSVRVSAARPISKPVPAPTMEPIATQRPIAPTPTPTLQPVASLTTEPAPNAAAQPVDAPIATSLPLDQMPLGDVARYYRLKKHESARANPQTLPGLVNVPTATESATTIPNVIPLDRMSLGDVARYYRAKSRDEAEASANQTSPISASAKPVPPISASTVSTLSATSTRHAAPNTSKSAYPLTLPAMPLASIKPPPTRALKPHSSRIVRTPDHPIARSTAPHPPAAPTRSVAGQATSIRITSGDTLWQLARKYLGSGTRWTELLALNSTIQNPRRLQIGAQLVLHPST